MKWLILAAALALAGCQVQEPTVPGTVLSVQEAKQALPEDLLRFDDDNIRVPEVAWQVAVQLDDGSQVTTLHTGSRRYAPGERVRVLVDADGALLL
jgi:outer membrane lipoprotein SlyB